MILITGPFCSGKRTVAAQILGRPSERWGNDVLADAQDLALSASDLTALADELATYPVVITTEVGSGVVPVDARQRASREAAGRLSCLLAARADTVIRVFCGIPIVLKGEL